jgi:uncharacterized RDD family membrane protein YckC
VSDPSERGRPRLWLVREPAEAAHLTPLTPPPAQRKTPPPAIHGEGSPYPKADLLLRALARLFDLLVCAAMVALAHQPGAILGAGYLLVADGLFRGQSLGKKLLGIKVIHLPTRQGTGARVSALRNYPMALLALLGIAGPRGWTALALSAVMVLGVEAYLVLQSPLGLRIGDELARTQVVDAKVVIGLPLLAADAGGGPARARLSQAHRTRDIGAFLARRFPRRRAPRVR